MRRAEQIKMGEAVPASCPVVMDKTPIARGALPEGTLAGLLVPRKTSRIGNQRRESRHYQLADHVQMSCEEGICQAKVVNMSERGMAIEAPLAVRIGEWVEIAFDDFEPIEGRVVWRKAGRMGLDFGGPAIELVPFS
jgi:hypothetical protein